MNQNELEHEREVAEVQADVRLDRGLNWVVISFAIIILTIIIAGIAFMLIPKDILKDSNQNTNPTGSTVNGR